MSTRSIIRVKLGGAYRVCQYVQSDGYPTWRGVEVLLFTRDLMEKGLETTFRNKVERSKSVLNKLKSGQKRVPRCDWLISSNITVGKGYPCETMTGAPTNTVRDKLMDMAWNARLIDISEDPYGNKRRSWYEAIEHLFAEGKINKREAAWLAVAGRDSGIGALKWMMAHDTAMTFYMPEELYALPPGGGPAGCDYIWGDYIIDLDERSVVCGYHGKTVSVSFNELLSIREKAIKDLMKNFEDSV